MKICFKIKRIYYFLVFLENVNTMTSFSSDFISSVIRQKGKSQKKFPKNKHFLSPDTHTCVCGSGGKNCLFFGNFGVLCFFETPVLRFALLPYYRRFQFTTSIVEFGSQKYCTF